MHEIYNIYILLHMITIALNCAIILYIDKKVKFTLLEYVKYFIFSPIMLIFTLIDLQKYRKEQKKKWK